MSALLELERIQTSPAASYSVPHYSYKEYSRKQPVDYQVATTSSNEGAEAFPLCQCGQRGDPSREEVEHPALLGLDDTPQQPLEMPLPPQSEAGSSSTNCDYKL